MRLILVLATLASLGLLAACGDNDSPDDGRSATGEVLEGTISDAMLPLATVRSQPPLLPPELQDLEGDEAPTPGTAAAPESAPSPDATSTPAESPAAPGATPTAAAE